jgi:hypothetical protein
MSSREDRAARKLEREQKRKEKSVKLVVSYIEDNVALTPKIQHLPDIEKRPLLDAKFGNLNVPKQPKSKHDGSRFGYKMTWCARIADQKGQWSWGESRLWSDDEWASEISSCLNTLQSHDWSEIQNMSSDTGHLMHHDHDVSSLCDEAVSRWFELEYEQFDTVFRFRLGNRKRAWGIEVQGHFYLIWYERSHLIYPTS